MNVKYITTNPEDTLDLTGGLHFIDVELSPEISSTQFSQFSVDFMKEFEKMAASKGHPLRTTKVEILEEFPVFNPVAQVTDYTIKAFRFYVVPTGIPIVILVLIIALVVAATWGVKATLRGVGKFVKETGGKFSFFFIFPVVIVIMAYFFLVYKGKARLQ